MSEDVHVNEDLVAETREPSVVPVSPSLCVCLPMAHHLTHGTPVGQ